MATCRLNERQLVGCADASEDFPGAVEVFLSGWMAWWEVSAELVVGSPLFVGHRQALGRSQALVPDPSGSPLEMALQRRSVKHRREFRRELALVPSKGRTLRASRHVRQ